MGNKNSAVYIVEFFYPKLKQQKLFWVMLYTWVAYIRAENGIFKKCKRYRKMLVLLYELEW